MTFTLDRFIEFALNHYILILALLTVTYLMIQEFLDAVFKKYSVISPMMAVTKMDNGSTVIIDVRENDEFNKGHIDGAVNLPLSKLKEQTSSLDPYKNKQVLIVCQEGGRANAAGKIFQKAGLEDIFVIAGGMQSWEEDYKLPIKVNRKH